MKYKNAIIHDLVHLQEFAKVLHKGVVLGDEQVYKIACETVQAVQRVRMKYVIAEKVKEFMETGMKNEKDFIK